jgi:hypothetical protein
MIYPIRKSALGPALSLLLFIILSTRSPLFGLENSINIGELSGKATENYPVQIARPFLKGEIVNFPQATVDGSPVQTQADVKTRWEDGSVKHAVLCFYIPNLKANATVRVNFKNQATGNNDGFLDKAGMLAPKLDFEAAMEMSGASTLKASARTMITDGAFTYWLKGGIATSVIIADHSIARKYDVGFDAHRAIRPIFLATFWPLINKVQVRYIGEIANTEAMEDQTYGLKLTSGLTSPQLAYSNPAVMHASNSRWTRVAWIGGAPNPISINHYLAYLTRTRFIPNYDPRKSIPAAALTQAYVNFKATNTDLYGAGEWQKAQGTAGGRQDIGPLPDWTVRWLYTGDKRMEEIAFTHADLSAAWPIHFREGKASKTLDAEGTVNGVGHVLSIRKRPTVFLSWLDYGYTLAADLVTPVAKLAVNTWVPNTAHQPECVAVQYMLTGDYWYLEELQFWASWDAAQSNGAAIIYTNGRGPTGAEGGIADEIRGQAWVLRTRVMAALLTPDSFPEKPYFTGLINDAISIWEGMHNITVSSFFNTPNWKWGRKFLTSVADVPPLNQWQKGAPEFAQVDYGIDKTKTYAAVSNFEQNFMMFSLGRARDLGFPAGPLATYLSVCVAGQVTQKDYNPYLISNGRLPTMRLPDTAYFKTWPELQKGYLPTNQVIAAFPLDDAVHGYDFIGLTAVAATNNGTAWNFMRTAVLGAPILSTNPKWAILPVDSIYDVVIGINKFKNRSFPNSGSNGMKLNWDQGGNRLNLFAPIQTGSELSIDLYNSMGIRVRNWSLPRTNAGEYALSFSGLEPAEGSYVCRVRGKDVDLADRILLYR